MTTLATLRRTVPTDLQLAALALALGLIVNVQLSSSVTRNGLVTSCSYLGLGEIIGGGIAVYLGIRQAINARPGAASLELGERRREPILALAGLAIVLGALVAMKGLGLLWSPCP